jgi:hypothetical protein
MAKASDYHANLRAALAESALALPPPATTPQIGRYRTSIIEGIRRSGFFGIIRSCFCNIRIVPIIEFRNR